MSECPLNTKGRVILLASVALNIFLVAFVAGRLNVNNPPPPPPAAEQADEAGDRADRPLRRGFRNDPDDRAKAGRKGMMPPMFGPRDLFEPDELRADETRMRENFEKMDALRKAFAAQLQAGPISKDDVLKHFASIDDVMGTVKKEAQDRAATRISSMSDEDRGKLAQTLLERGKDGAPFGNRMHQRMMK